VNRTWTLAGVAVFALFVCGALADDKPAPRGRGSLPPMWSKLGLTDEQRRQVYSQQAEFRAKIDDLENQIRQLRKQERVALEKVLTDAQRARLRELVSEKGPAATPPQK
jgi:Spy/CpxP family protein refolding chaperone